MKKGGTNKINKRLKNKGLHLYIENEFFVKNLFVRKRVRDATFFLIIMLVTFAATL